MKKKLRFSVILIILASGILVLMGGKSQATLQSNPNTQYIYAQNKETWISNIRTMEDVNGAMGLAETRGTNLTSTTSNNIDVHFMKSTEYGAIAILSASGYGNSSNEQAITTTTGNNTGIMIDTTCYEWVAGYGYEVSGPDARYYDRYGDQTAGGKIGDAIITCAGWHSAEQQYWVATTRTGANAFLRGYSGIFSYHGCASNGDNHGILSQSNGKPSGWTTSNWNAFGRGVAVCGQGL